MKISTFEHFGARNSAPVFAAFRDAAIKHGFQCVSHDHDADVAVIWSVVWAGRMRANHDIWKQFRNTDRPVIVLEVGMIDRGRTWKIGINGTGSEAIYCKSRCQDRAHKLGLDAKPWKLDGQHILIALQRTDSEQWHNMPNSQTWLNQIVTTLRRYTDREIRVRPHPRQRAVIPAACTIEQPRPVLHTYDSFDIAAGLNGAWAVINHNSGPGCISVIQGCPAFVHRSSLAYTVANLDLCHIESPQRPDRSQWLVDLAHTEWTLDEIAHGDCVNEILTLAQSL